jgi:Asp-tRNA(Asn)/Glu-tRNA(Gln) amidotransferase A subunit family amidase
MDTDDQREGSFDEVAWLDGVAQAELVRRREVTAVELVEAAIARIDRLNPRLNAVVTCEFERALEIARRGPGRDGRRPSPASRPGAPARLFRSRRDPDT